MCVNSIKLSLCFYFHISEDKNKLKNPFLFVLSVVRILCGVI